MAVEPGLAAIKPVFHRSVNLERDWQNTAFHEAYIVTPEIRDLATRISRELLHPLGSRAWSLTGPYGTGKSAFLLFLTDILSRKQPLNEEAQAIRTVVGLGSKRLFPVLITGRREPLTSAVLRTLDQAFNSFQSQRLESNVMDASKELLDLVLEHGYDGILLILDECGKFLEYASLHPSEEDLYVLQLLAEFAAREVGRFALVTIFHSAFADYLDISSEVRRREWQKVQGRFTDVPFQLPLEQMMELVAAAIDFDPQQQKYKQYENVIRSSWESEGFAEARKRFPSLRSLLSRCAPLDPATALILWSLFRSKLAQNERSLFGFLNSYEPFGFASFLEGEVFQGDTSQLYTLDILYDYVVSSLGPGTVVGDQGRAWGEIQQALERLPAIAPQGADQVLKALGLLNLYGGPVGLLAKSEVIQTIFRDLNLSKILDFLQKASLVVFRRYNQTYAIWEGSDINVAELYDEALRRVGGQSLKERVEAVVMLRPWVARKHYIDTGTLRYFNVGLVEPSKEKIEEFYAVTPASGDGKIGFVLAHEAAGSNELLDHIIKVTAQKSVFPCIFAIPKNLTRVDQLVREVEAWTWILENVRELQSDRVAREEVRVRLRLAKQRLESAIGRILGLRGAVFDPSASSWVYAGSQNTFNSSRDFSRWLSQICDETYVSCPKLHNELLNRDQLSSAAAAARRSLLEAMIDNQHQDKLGIVGSSATATMYRSMLEVGGMHIARGGRFEFGRPKSDWAEVWDRVESLLRDSKEHPRPVTEIYEVLRRPPFGMREGPMPILLVAILLANQAEVGLYEDGLYVPNLRIEVVERLVRNPQNFSVRSFHLDGAARLTLRRLSEILPELVDSSGQGPREELLELVRPLVILTANLVPFAKQTRRFSSDRVVKVREALLSATDPYALIFQELPRALDVSLNDEKGVERFVDGLRDAIAQLHRAYDTLLMEIEDAFRAAFVVDERGQEAFRKISHRAQRLARLGTNSGLALFIAEACREGPKWQERLARVVSNGRPPSHWRDNDVSEFSAKLQVLANDFIRLEEMVGESPDSVRAPIIRVTIVDSTVKDYRAVLEQAPEKVADIEKLQKKIWGILEQSGIDRSISTVVLGRLMERMIEDS